MQHRPLVYGIQFDSRLEANRYLILLDMANAGLLYGLEPHPVFDITPPGQRSRRYTADFRYRDPSGRFIVEEVKPKSKKARSRTRDFRLRMDLARARYPDHDFRLVEM